MSGSFFGLPSAPNIGMGFWSWTLQRASFRGVPFAVRASTVRQGRRNVVHEYPYRDVVWVEDLGRGARLISFTGFLIGEDVFDQRDALSDAINQPGSGELVHPSLGSCSASATGDITMTELAEQGRVVQVELSFLVGGAEGPEFPEDTVQTSGVVTDAAGNLRAMSAGDWFRKISGSLAYGKQIIQSGTAVIGSWVALGTRIISSPSVVASALGIPGVWGRFGSGNFDRLRPPSSTVQGSLDAMVLARAAVVTAGATAVASTSDDMPDNVQAFAEAVRATAFDPGAQLDLVIRLCDFDPPPDPSAAAIGDSLGTVWTATTALVRRAAIASLADGSSEYAATTQDEFAARLSAVTSVIDAEIEIAGATGDDDTYVALRALRTAVVEDLTVRAVGLPSLTRFTRVGGIPSLALAYELYGDTDRRDNLVREVDPVHPGMMPRDFNADGR